MIPQEICAIILFYGIKVSKKESAGRENMQSLETLTERDFDSVWEIMEESFPRDE